MLGPGRSLGRLAWPPPLWKIQPGRRIRLVFTMNQTLLQQSLLIFQRGKPSLQRSGGTLCFPDGKTKTESFCSQPGSGGSRSSPGSSSSTSLLSPPAPARPVEDSVPRHSHPARCPAGWTDVSKETTFLQLLSNPPSGEEGQLADISLPFL